jgi:hypothetical protein
MAGIATATGSWRTASLCGAAFALLVLAIMVINRDALDDRQGEWAHQAKGAASAQCCQARASHGLPQAAFGVAVLFVLLLEHLRAQRHPELCQPRAAVHVRPAAERDGHGGHRLHAVRRGGHGGGRLSGGPRAAAGESDLGVPAGSAALLVLVGTGWLPGMAAVVVASIAGLGTGLAGPSRDMLIKRAAPPGATGRVYGTVYSGLDLGFCLAAPVFGAMLDRGMTSGIFFGSAATLALSVVSAALVGVGVAARQDVLRVQRALDGAHHVHRACAGFVQQKAHLVQAHAMLAGAGAAHADRARATSLWFRASAVTRSCGDVGVEQVAEVEVAVAHMAHQEVGDAAGLGLVHRFEQAVGQAADGHAGVGADGAAAGAALHGGKVGVVPRGPQAGALFGRAGPFKGVAAKLAGDGPARFRPAPSRWRASRGTPSAAWVLRADSACCAR